MLKVPEAIATPEVKFVICLVKGMIVIGIKTSNKAKELGIFGYVGNLSNGDVEIVAQGEKSKLDKLINWCYSGSSSAIVRDVKVEMLSESMIKSNDFDIRYL